MGVTKPCGSRYSGNECEFDAGHDGPHAHWIEGYGDQTWTDEQAEAEHQHAVDFWRERGVTYPPVEPSVRGRPFKAKEGVPFTAGLYVRLHPDELGQIDALRGQESRSDWVRAAIREKLLRDARVEREQEMNRRLAPFYAEQENGR